MDFIVVPSVDCTWNRSFEYHVNSETLESDRPIRFGRHAATSGVELIGISVRVTCSDGRQWVGMFENGLGGMSGVVNIPDPHTLCVVAAGNAYMVSAYDPQVVSTVDCSPVRLVLCSMEQGIVVFGSFSGLAAYDRQGLLWKHRDLFSDELAISLHGDYLLIEGSSAEGSASSTLVLRARSGRAVIGVR